MPVVRCGQIPGNLQLFQCEKKQTKTVPLIYSIAQIGFSFEDL